jgi:hypothetical protein
MKITLHKIMMCVLLLQCAFGYVAGQSNEENQFVFAMYNWSGPSNTELRFQMEDNTVNIFNITPDMNAYWNYLAYFCGIPKTIKVSTDCASQTQNYTYGGMDGGFDVDCWDNYQRDVYFEYNLKGPAIIKNIDLMENNSVITLNYACPDARIRLEVEDHGVNAGGLGNYDSYGVECRNAGSTWKKIKLEGSGQYRYILFSEIVNAGVDPYQNMTFRTRRELLRGNYSTSTSAKQLRYLPQFQFPAGTNLIVEPPRCSDGNAVIKIPYSGSTVYTVNIINSGGMDAFNGSTNSIPTETTGGINYYVINENLPSGTYTLKIELVASCIFETAFVVPAIPAFTIGNVQYPNKFGNYEVTQHGGTGQLQFDVAGSCRQEITVIVRDNANSANTLTFERTLNNSSQTDGITYYGGTVTVNLPAGSYNISVTN